MVAPMLPLEKHLFEPYFYYNEENKAYYFIYNVGSCHLSEIDKISIKEWCRPQLNKEDCLKMLLPPNYQKNLPPGPSFVMHYINLTSFTSSQLIGHVEEMIINPIDVNIELETVEKHTDSYVYQFDISLNYSWADNRLCTPVEEGWILDVNINLNSQLNSHPWIPFFFFNVSAAHLSQTLIEPLTRLTIESRVKIFDHAKLSTNRTGFWLMSDGEKHYIVRPPKLTIYQHIRLDVLCEPNLESFPLENLTCKIELLSQEDQACVRWFKNPKLNQAFKLYGFEASLSEIKAYRSQGYQSLTLSGIKFTVQFKRTPGIAWRVWTLSIISLIVTFGSFISKKVIKPFAAFFHLIFGLFSFVLIHSKYSQNELGYFFSPFTLWFILIVIFLLSSLALFSVSQMVPDLLPKKYTRDEKLKVTREILYNEARKNFFELIRSVTLVIFFVSFFISLVFLFFQSEFFLDIDYFKKVTSDNLTDVLFKNVKETNGTLTKPIKCLMPRNFMEDDFPLKYFLYSPTTFIEDHVWTKLIDLLEKISMPIGHLHSSDFETVNQDCVSQTEMLKNIIWHQINNFTCTCEHDLRIHYKPVTFNETKVPIKTTTTTAKATTVPGKPRVTTAATTTTLSTTITGKVDVVFFDTEKPTQQPLPSYPPTMKLPYELEQVRKELNDIRQKIKDIHAYNSALAKMLFYTANFSFI